MAPELPQPFDQDAIIKDPKAVVIALMIGLLLILGGVIALLYYRKEKQSDVFKQETIGLYNTILEERNARVFFYEEMIFYKTKSDKQVAVDSIIKQKTKPLLKKLLP